MTLEDHINRLLMGGSDTSRVRRSLDQPTTDPVIAPADLSRTPTAVTRQTYTASSKSPYDPFATSIDTGTGQRIATGPGSWQDVNNGPFKGLSDQPKPAPTTSPLYGNADAAGQAWLASGGRTPQDLAAFASAHPEYGITIGGSKGDKATVGGRTFDAVIAAGEGGRGASWTDITNGGSDFADPTAQNLESLAQTLQSYFSTPQSNPQLDTYLQSLAAEQATAKQRASDYAGTLNNEIAQLKEPAYTPEQLATLRTQATDALEARRQATLKNAREAAYLKGFAPTSGTVKQAEDQVNQSFDQQRAGIESQLASNEINQGVNNRNLAITLEGLVHQALNGGDLTAIQSAADAATARAADLRTQDQRALEALSSAQIPYTMSEQGLQDLLSSNSALGGSTSTADPLSTILSLLSYANQQQQLKDARTSNILSGIGTIGGLVLPLPF